MRGLQWFQTLICKDYTFSLLPRWAGAPGVEARCLVTSPNRNQQSLAEGHCKVPCQILRILDADRNPDQTLGDAERSTHLRRCSGMSHQGWQRNQTFDTAKAFGQRE